jgi:hypothetical protein
MAPCMHNSIVSLPLRWQLRIIYYSRSAQFFFAFLFSSHCPLHRSDVGAAARAMPCFLWPHQTSEKEKRKRLGLMWPIATHHWRRRVTVPCITSLLFVWRCACLLCYSAHCYSFLLISVRRRPWFCSRRLFVVRQRKKAFFCR